MMRLDHIAVSAASLDDGAERVSSALGVATEPGGVHALMGTHNRLLSLGPDEYLEVIAIDPAAPKPAHPRWFGLDHFAGPPRVTNWICRTDDLDAAIAALPGSGAGLSLVRGDFVWRMAVPPEGQVPLDGAQPALIQWEGAAHPAPRLPDRGCRLVSLAVSHPKIAMLRARLDRLIDDPRIALEAGPPGIRAEISTSSGVKVLT